MNEAEIKEYLNSEGALARIGKNAKLLKRLLMKFLEDTPKQFEQLKREIAENDRAAAAKSVHTLKGVAGNLSMTKLFELSPPFEALLKTGDDASATFAEYSAVYEKTLEAANAVVANLP
ncbi:MAG: Hpt domain-containing protein [Synergistaceae bacterium]|nr:Hpt domain-containing protein [Synergistaceae bacterium]